jgi:gas vesicle protein
LTFSLNTSKINRKVLSYPKSADLQGGVMESKTGRVDVAKHVAASLRDDYRESVRKLIDEEVKKAVDLEMQKAAQELIEEHKKATRQILEEYRSAIQEIVKEEKEKIRDRAEQLKKSILQMGL